MPSPRQRYLQILVLALPVLVGQASAQSGELPTFVLDEVDRMDFDRPESWALKYFAAVSMMTGMGTPEPVRFGSIKLSLETGWIPSLTEDQRRVGFVGYKVEDLNRNSWIGRFRATFGLPGDFSVTLAYSPPIERHGVEAELINLALARPVLNSEKWRLGLRLHGQLGKIEGDFTCPENIVGLEDPDRNPDACVEPSADRVGLDYVGLEFSATPQIWGPRWEPYLAVSGNYLDLEFQVDARYSIFLDRNLLLTDGWIYYLAAGTTRSVTEKLQITGELFYAPLDVVRSPSSGSENDGIFNARLQLSYSIR